MAEKPDLIGIIGLGIMGRAIARRLTASGYDLPGWNRSPLAAETAADNGHLTADVAMVIRDVWQPGPAKTGPKPD